MAEINFRAFGEPFRVDEIEWRLQQSGEKNGRVWAICVPYVTNRAIQQRLDEVAGAANWKNEFAQGPEGGVLCGLSVKTDGEWVTKWDGAENTDIEGVKGGLSGAMKRAAVQWGIGRYLYGLDESFANVHEAGKLRGKTRDGKSFRWDPPRLPDWALPGGKEEPDSRTHSLADARSQHEAMLEFIRSVGPRIDEAAEIKVAGKPHNLKTFVRENWATLKEQVRLTKTAVKAVEAATGTRFRGEAA